MFSWVEIYIGMDYKKFIQIANLMESSGILTKTKVKNMRNRMTNDVIARGNPMALNSSGMNFLNEEYKIMVKKDTFEKAKRIISSNKNYL